MGMTWVCPEMEHTAYCKIANRENDDKPRDLGIHDVWTKMGAGQKHSRYDVSHEPEMNIHESQLL